MATRNINLQRHVTALFTSLFGRKQDTNPQMKRRAWDSATDLEDLEGHFTKLETKEAVWKLGVDKASRPDRFPIRFFRTFDKSLEFPT